MSDALSLELEHTSPDGDAECSTESQDKAASPALLPTTFVSVPEQGTLVGAARPTIDGQTKFDYEAVPDAIVGKLRETAVRIRHRSGMYLIQTGQDLLGWRDQLKRGQFQRWIEQECNLELRTAQLAMMVARYAYLLDERERENFSRLPVAIQYQLAAPSVPDGVRAQVLETSAAGRPIKVATVKEMVRAAKRKTDSPASSLDNDTRTNRSTENEDGPAARAEAASAKDDAIFSAPETDRLPTLSVSDPSKAPEIQRPARAILQSKLDAATDDPRRQAIIKEIFVLVNKMSAIDRVNLISSLSKLADIRCRQLAECLQ